MAGHWKAGAVGGRQRQVSKGLASQPARPFSCCTMVRAGVIQRLRERARLSDTLG